ncbi:MAG TPA: NADH-quinone oxidoreductase subunit J [Myxococcota bacterium]|nr:NADH-quinone oxidoreductase subunit J [Myxococcota bacterium]
MNFSVPDLVFYAVALVTLATAVYAVTSRNIVRAVFSLLGTFFGMALLYGLLAADFVAVIQVLVYVGGILVLLLFAVMLTGNIETAQHSNRSAGLWLGALTGLSLLALLLPLAIKAPWQQSGVGEYAQTTASIGTALLSNALLPFEVISIVLLGIVIGAVVIARHRRVEDTEAGK